MNSSFKIAYYLSLQNRDTVNMVRGTDLNVKLRWNLMAGSSCQHPVVLHLDRQHVLAAYMHITYNSTSNLFKRLKIKPRQGSVINIDSYCDSDFKSET